MGRLCLVRARFPERNIGEEPLPKISKVVLSFVALLSPVLSRSQTGQNNPRPCVDQVPSSQTFPTDPTTSEKGTTVGSKVPACPDQKDGSQAKQTKRMLW